MRIRKSPIAMWMLVVLAACAGATGAATPASRPAGAIDFLDYFLQTDDRDERWTINGTDVRPAPDPDGAGARTVVLNKWSDPNCYEIFKITDAQVQIRYEVVRSGGASGKENWIRRYREINGDGPSPGAVWMTRSVVPGGPGMLSRFAQDRWVFDDSKREYVIDAGGSVKEMEIYASCDWADVRWPMGNTTGVRIDRVLRLTSEWQREGLMVETYDYAKGKGLVGWRWLERVSTLRPLETDLSGRVFHCEEGLVYLERANVKEGKPRVWKFQGGKRGRELEVVQFQSHWKPEIGKQWYVVYRDLSREKRLTKTMERIEHDYALPEWDLKKTIADLPGLYTR